MSDELRKAARELLELEDSNTRYTLRELLSRQKQAHAALRAALAETEQAIRDDGTRMLAKMRPKPLASDAADYPDPIREPTQEEVEAWRKQASSQASIDAYKHNDVTSHSKRYWDTYAYQIAALAYAAGHKAGSGT